MTRLIQGLAALLLLAYPFLVYFGIQFMSPGVLGLCLLGLALLRFALVRGRPGAGVAQSALLALLLCVVLYALLAGEARAFRYYPVAVNAVMLLIFALSLWRGPPMIERFARLAEPALPDHALPYTRKVTVVWCAFFLGNGLVALYTAAAGSMELWVLYNGLLSYLLMAVLFAGEYLVRRVVRRKYDASFD